MHEVEQGLPLVQTALMISEYLQHFHAERNHQELANVIPFPETTATNDSAPIERRQRLGGLLTYYHRKAA